MNTTPLTNNPPTTLPTLTTGPLKTGPTRRSYVKTIGALTAALCLTAATVGCGSGSDGSATTATASSTAMAASDTASQTPATTATAAVSDAAATTDQQADSGNRTDSGGPGAFGKNVDASSITTVEDLNALINEAYGDGGLGLHRGHQPVEQVLIDTLGISHDEMHVRMDAGQNLAAIAEDQGVGTQTLIDALVNNWQPAIDNVENEGLIDADQAAQYHQALVDAFTFKVTWNGSDTAPTFTGV